MRHRARLPIPAIIVVATGIAGALGIWQGLRQPPAEGVVVPGTAKAPLSPVPDVPEPGSEAGRLGGALAGRVVAADGQPVSGAVVQASPGAFLGRPSLNGATLPAPQERPCDARGHFALEVSPDWAWTLTATAGELAGVRVDVMPPDTALVIVLVGAQPVSGAVRERGGRPVPGAVVTATAEKAAAPAFEGTSGADGSFQFQHVPAGAWRIDAVDNAAPPGRGTLGRERRRAQATVQVLGAPPAPVVLELAALGTVKGRVTAPAGTELAQLTVFAVPSSMARAMMGEPYAAQVRLLPQSYASSRVAADGRFELADVAGPQALIVPHPALSHPIVNAEPDGPEVVIALAKERVVRGKVVDAAGQPVARFEVNGAAFTAPDGAFTWAPPVIPGAARPTRQTLVVTAAGFSPLTAVAEFKEGDADVGVLKLEAGRTLTLTVVEAAGGQPVTAVTFSRLDGSALAAELAEVVSPGVYRLTRLPSGAVTLALTLDTGAVRRVEIGPGDTELTYRFSAGATLRGVVVSADGRPAVGARVFPSGEMRATQLTDQDGRFVMPGREPGELKLVALFGRATAIKSVVVPPSGEVEVQVALPPVP